ncbi:MULTISPECIES: hypothetical protein [unclassified Acinetobacter]|uniref:hypothetical protein n=1 Tax=unclassified Acinetobacter TaxID=196816 RepID=UPI0015D240C7|nr:MULTISPECIES: hypothetical protein [unclassified Acinetobacter]
MKYILSAAVFSLALIGCADKKATVENTVSTEPASATTPSNDIAIAQDEQVIHFTGPQDLTIELKTKDNFETAQLTDNSDRVYELKRAVSGSGVRLANDQGVSIHFKNFNGVNEGTVELVKDKPIEIKEFIADKAK